MTPCPLSRQKGLELTRGRLWLPRAVLQLAWRPATSKAEEDKGWVDLAVAGEDGSLRVYGCTL